MKKILIIIKSRFKIIFRKNILIYLLILAPLILMGVSQQIYKYSAESIRVGIYDGDKSDISRALMNFLKANKKITTFDINEEALKSFVSNSDVHAAILIPANFQRDIIDGKFEIMQVMTLQNNEVAVWIKNFTNNYISTLMDISIAADGKNEAFFEIYSIMDQQNILFKNIDVKDRSTDVWVLVQSVGLMLLLMLITGLVVANNIIEDRNRYIDKRIKISEVSKARFILANALVVIIINFIQITLFIMVLQIITKNVMLESFIMFGMLLLFSFVSAGIAMVLITTRRTISKSTRLFAVIIIPTCAISGCFWQLRLMPESLQKMASFFPQGAILKALLQMHAEKYYGDVGITFLLVFIYSCLFIGGSLVVLNRESKEKNFKES